MTALIKYILLWISKILETLRLPHTDSLLVSVLVFLTVFLLMFVVLRFFYKKRDEQWQEKRTQQVLTRQLDPLEYFIEGQDLLLIRVSSAILLALLPVFLPQYGVPKLVSWIISGLMLALGYMLPLWYFKLKVHWRQQKFENQMVVMLSGIISGLRGGMDIRSSIFQAAPNLPEPMREALETVSGEVRMNLSLEDAMERMYNRFPCEDLRLVVTTVKLSLKNGGSTAEVLEKQLEVVRKRKEVQGKIKSMTSQGMMESYFLCLSPFLFIFAMYYSDPSLVKPLFTTMTGWKIVGIGTLLDVVGFFWLQKMVRIQI